MTNMQSETIFKESVSSRLGGLNKSRRDTHGSGGAPVKPPGRGLVTHTYQPRWSGASPDYAMTVWWDRPGKHPGSDRLARLALGLDHA